MDVPINHREGGRRKNKRFNQQLQTELQGVTPIGGDTALEYLSVEVSSEVRVRLELLE